MSQMSCAVIGCHPTRFKFKYQEQNNGCKKIKKVLDQQLRQIYESGVHRFLIPGTLGVGIWAGEMLLRMKEQPEYSELELVMVLPYAGHESAWDSHNKTRLTFLLCHATDKITLTGKGSKDYQQTYFYMAEQCEKLVAVCDDPSQDDAGQAVICARKKGCAVTIIHPDNGKIINDQSTFNI